MNIIISPDIKSIDSYVSDATKAAWDARGHADRGHEVENKIFDKGLNKTKDAAAQQLLTDARVHVSKAHQYAKKALWEARKCDKLLRKAERAVAKRENPHPSLVIIAIDLRKPYGMACALCSFAKANANKAEALVYQVETMPMVE